MNCRVYNDNNHDYVNVVKGEKITIKAKSYIEVPREKAVNIRGAFLAHPKTFDGAGVQNPESYSRLRIVPIDSSKTNQPEKFVCHATGMSFDTLEQLKHHQKEIGEDLVERNRQANEVEENVQKRTKTKGNL